MKRWPIHLCRVAAAFAGCLMAGGCATAPGVIFPAPRTPLAWPAAPERARVRYVGQLATEADLKPAVPFDQQLGQAIFGKKSVRSMLTPFAVCTDGADRLFVADSNAQCVHVFNLASRQYAQWRPVAPKSFSQPVGIAFDSAGGRLFVADSVAGSIFCFDTAGKLTAEIGAAVLKRPCGLAYDQPRARLYVTDAALHQVVILAPTGETLGRIGSRGTALGQFNYPTNVAVDSQGRLYVSDSLNFRVQQFGPDFAPIRQIGRKGDLPGYFGQPKGIAIDSQDHLYVVDSNFEAVQVFNAAGQILMDFGQEGTGPGEFWLPAGICIDPRNRIWIADAYNRRIQVFDYLPEVSP